MPVPSWVHGLQSSQTKSNRTPHETPSPTTISRTLARMQIPSRTLSHSATERNGELGNMAFHPHDVFTVVGRQGTVSEPIIWYNLAVVNDGVNWVHSGQVEPRCKL